MAPIVALLLAAVCLLRAAEAQELYKVVDLRAEGELTVTARKEYNYMDRKGNKTVYDIKLESPLLEKLDQEIRISLQWIWQQEYGVATERVIFYGKARNKLFSDYRIDQHPVTHGGYLFDNWYAPQFSKYYFDLQPQSADLGERYTFLDIGEQEVFLENQTAMFSVMVDRDEPYLSANKIMINWGIFDDEKQNTGGEVFGSKEFQEYVIQFNFNDYFDRPLIYMLWSQIFWSSFFGPFLAPLFQMFSSLYLIGYVMVQPSLVFFLLGGKSYFSFDQWFFDIGFRWQFLNIFSLAVLFMIEITASLSAFYYLYAMRKLVLYTSDPSQLLTVLTQDLQTLAQSSTIDWSIFGAILATGYALQVTWSLAVILYLQVTLVY